MIENECLVCIPGIWGDIACEKCRNRRDKVLKWTKEKPKEAGWYWYKTRKNGKASCVEFVKYCNAIRKITRWGYGDYVEDMRGFFAGPIPEPEEDAE